MDNSCQFQILHQNHFGHITQCLKCRKIQVRIGTTLLQLSELAFSEFCTELNDKVVELTKQEVPIYLPTSRSTGIYLNYHQFIEANELLQIGIYMIKVHQYIGS